MGTKYLTKVYNSLLVSFTSIGIVKMRICVQKPAKTQCGNCENLPSRHFLQNFREIDVSGTKFHCKLLSRIFFWSESNFLVFAHCGEAFRSKHFHQLFPICKWSLRNREESIIAVEVEKAAFRIKTNIWWTLSSSIRT